MRQIVETKVTGKVTKVQYKATTIKQTVKLVQVSWVNSTNKQNKGKAQKPGNSFQRIERYWMTENNDDQMMS